MSKELIALATCQWTFTANGENTIETDHIILTEVENFSDAMARIEQYYGTDLEVCEITLLEGPFLHVNGINFDKIITGEINQNE